ncbi:MAG: hypothetical protein JXB48_24810 [Candidatus Latescibacteria bacterium]|nr:hypothetical protein [Candidatus Latescibacterota bacterium]
MLGRSNRTQQGEIIPDGFNGHEPGIQHQGHHRPGDDGGNSRTHETEFGETDATLCRSQLDNISKSWHIICLKKQFSIDPVLVMKLEARLRRIYDPNDNYFILLHKYIYIRE